MEPSSPDSPSLRDQLADWWHDAPKQRTTIGLGITSLVAMLGCAILLARGPEQVQVPVEVITKAKVVAIPVQSGEDLGIIGARFQRSRIEMIGYNIELLRANTAKCDRMGRTSGVCRRDKFGEEDLAPDAVWPEDIVYVITHDALDIPALASTHTATP